MHLLFGLPLVFIVIFIIVLYYYDNKDKKLMEDIDFKARTKEELALDALITMSLRKEDKDESK